MKKNFTKLLVLVSAGTICHAGPTAFAGDAQTKSDAQTIRVPVGRIEIRGGNINEPVGAGLGVNATADQFLNLQRASELIGTDVRNQHGEKLGDVKDLMMDLQSGNTPFAVISSGGFFGAGDRLLAVPMSTFMKNAGLEDNLVLSMDRERLKAAPSFDRNSWPDMSDQSWSSQIYSYYGAQPSMQSSVATGTSTQINEAAGAQRQSGWSSGSSESSPPSYSSDISQSYGETTTGLSRDRTPRQGLGAEDLTKNQQKIYNPGGYAESDAFFSESAGAEGHTDKAPSGKVKRASELIGMEVKNALNEHIGEIEDVVLDMRSGRVAYAVLDVGGLPGVEEKFYAVPPTVFTRSGDDRWLVFNTDKETLKKAPSFEKNNWSQAENQQFTSEVYRFYHQTPYWQTSGQIREPAGSQQSHDSSSEWQRGGRNYENNIEEPSGAAPAPSAPGGELNEPSPQAEPERYQGQQSDVPQSQQDQSRSSAQKETSELQSTPQYQQQAQPQSQESQLQEPAGATTESTAPATSQDQAPSDADRQLIQKLKGSLQTDTTLSPVSEKVQVSAANGRITLRGTVETEQQKQSIAAKAQQIVGSADKVDNQLKVSGSLTP